MPEVIQPRILSGSLCPGGIGGPAARARFGHRHAWLSGVLRPLARSDRRPRSFDRCRSSVRDSWCAGFAGA